MMRDLLWPRDKTTLDLARKGLRQLTEVTSPEEIEEITAALDEVLRGKSMAAVILALVAKLGGVLSLHSGPTTAHFAAIAAALQLSWKAARERLCRPTHH